MFLKEANWNLIPEHCRDGLRNYFEVGRSVGDFLTAVLENNLVEAFGRADHINEHCLKDYANFLYNYAPSYPVRSWGSPEAVQAWREMGGLKGFKASQAEVVKCDICGKSFAPDDCIGETCPDCCRPVDIAERIE
jgi:hypothetical protein